MMQEMRRHSNQQLNNIILVPDIVSLQRASFVLLTMNQTMNENKF